MYLDNVINEIQTGQVSTNPAESLTADLKPVEPSPSILETAISGLSSVNDYNPAVQTASVAGGLVQGMANFLASTLTGMGMAEYHTGGLINPISPRNLQYYAAEFNNLFIPWLNNDEWLNTERAQRNNDSSAWNDVFSHVSEQVAGHPIFNPEIVGKSGADIQALIGGFFHWVGEDAAPYLGDATFEALGEDQGAAAAGAAVQTFANGLAMLAPYFDTKAIMGGLQRYNNAKNPNIDPETNKRTIFDPVSNEWRELDGSIPYSPVKPSDIGNFGSRPGTVKSTTEATRNRAGELIHGQDSFIHVWRKANPEGSQEAALKAWYEYSNEVTKEMYPQAYMAFEHGKTLLDTQNGPVAYLQSIYGLKGGLEGTGFGFNNKFTFDGAEYAFKDYITYTVPEFYEAFGNVEAAPKVHAAYLKYIKEKANQYGLEPVNNFTQAQERAFDIRDMEFKKLQSAQIDLAWKERYLEEVIGPAEERALAEQSKQAVETRPEGRGDFLRSNEGPDYTSEQVQDYFDYNAARDIADAHIDYTVNRATRPVDPDGNLPPRNFRRQGGYADPEVFKEGTAKMVELVRNFGDDKSLAELAREGKLPPPEVSNVDRPLSASIYEWLGLSTSIDWIRANQEFSPTMKTILDKLDRPLEGQGRGDTTTFNEAYKMSIAKFNQDIKTALSPLAPREYGTYGGLSKKQNKMLLDYMRGILPEHKTPLKVRQAANGVRKVLDAKHKELVDAGIPGLSDKIGYLENYMHRVYDPRKMKKNKQGWLDVMAKHDINLGFAEEIYNNLVNHERLFRVEPDSFSDLFKDSGDAARRKSSIDYERILADIPDSELAPFLSDNFHDIMVKYGQEAAHRKSFGERFGINKEILNADLYQASKELAAAGKPMPHYVGQRIYDVVNAIDHNYNQIKSPAMRKFQRGVLAGTNLALLPLVTLVSTPELLVPLSKVGVGDFVRAMPHTLGIVARRTARRIYNDIPKNQREMMFEATSAAMDAMSQERMLALFSGEASALDALTFKMYGLHHFTRFSKLSAVNAFVSHMESLLKAAESEKSFNRWKAQGGFTGARAARLQEFLDYYGMDLVEGLEWQRAGRPNSGTFYNKMVRGALRFSEDSVLTPNPATVPLWHSNPHLAWLKHLSTFPAMMMTRVMQPWMRNMSTQRNNFNPMLYGPQVGATIGGMLAMGYFINQLTDMLRWGSASDTPFEKTAFKEGIRAFERVGFLGPLSKITDSVFYSKYGLFSTVFGPSVALAGEASIYTKDILTKGQTTQMSKFLAKNASIFGRLEGTRDPLTDLINDNLKEVARGLRGPRKRLKRLGD